MPDAGTRRKNYHNAENGRTEPTKTTERQPQNVDLSSRSNWPSLLMRIREVRD